MDIKIGDVVELKSGGPDMTVSERRSDGSFGCTWFNGQGGNYEVKYHPFKSDLLKKKR